MHLLGRVFSPLYSRKSAFWSNDKTFYLISFEAYYVWVQVHGLCSGPRVDR